MGKGRRASGRDKSRGRAEPREEERPRAAAAAAAHWTRKWSKQDNDYYYFNTVTKESTWDEPEGFEEEEEAPPPPPQARRAAPPAKGFYESTGLAAASQSGLPSGNLQALTRARAFKGTEGPHDTPPPGEKFGLEEGIVTATSSLPTRSFRGAFTFASLLYLASPEPELELLGGVMRRDTLVASKEGESEESAPVFSADAYSTHSSAFCLAPDATLC